MASSTVTTSPETRIALVTGCVHPSLHPPLPPDQPIESRRLVLNPSTKLPTKLNHRPTTPPTHPPTHSADKGIGLEFVCQLQKEGYLVVACAKDASNAKELLECAERNQNKIFVQQLDQARRLSSAVSAFQSKDE